MAIKQKIRLPFNTKETAITLRIIRSSPASLFGLVVVVGFLVIAVAVWLSHGSILPQNPYNIQPSQILKPPSAAHWLGTDELGRDVLSRILAGTPIDAEVALSVVAIALVLGTATGCFAGYVGGPVEEIVMRITDIFLAFPAIVLALAIVAALGPGIGNSILALAPVWWPSYTRLSRGQALAIKSQDYIKSSRALGHRSRFIILHHVIPNVVPVMLVYATLDVGSVILAFSVLSYIGLGAQPPLPEWGLLASQNQEFLKVAPWTSVSPALVILLVAIGFSLLGDGLRDALEPRVRGLFG